jgi:transketolase
MLVLTRQNLPILDRHKVAGAEGVLRGAYVLAREQGAAPDLVLIASGSEVELILAAREELVARGIDARAVSMPSWELFREQPQEYRDQVLPPPVKARLAVEAAVPMGWHEWVGDGGDIIGITRFGASAPAKENFKRFGFTVDHVVERATRLVRR